MLPNEILAELHAFTPGRVLDDHVQVMLRYANGARGMLWSSQMATGCESSLRLRVYGSKASLSFAQENPNELWVTPQGWCAQRLTRGRVRSAKAEAATRVPSGHPEGYLEAFAQLYRDTAVQIHAMDAGQTMPALTQGMPDVGDGVAGLKFMEAALRSNRSGSCWIRLGE